jgi:hypothetical protein
LISGGFSTTADFIDAIGLFSDSFGSETAAFGSDVPIDVDCGISTTSLKATGEGTGADSLTDCCASLCAKRLVFLAWAEPFLETSEGLGPTSWGSRCVDNGHWLWDELVRFSRR